MSNCIYSWKIYEFLSLQINIFIFIMFCGLLGIMFKLLSYMYQVQLYNEVGFFINLNIFFFFSLCGKSGWESIAGESHLNALLIEVFHKTHKEAIQRFQTLLNDRNTYLLSIDTRKVKVLPVLLNHFLISRGIFQFYIQQWCMLCRLLSLL